MTGDVLKAIEEDAQPEPRTDGSPVEALVAGTAGAAKARKQPVLAGPRTWDADELRRRERYAVTDFGTGFTDERTEARVFRAIAAEREAAGNPPPTSEFADRIPT